jgi:hypothetical protein
MCSRKRIFPQVDQLTIDNLSEQHHSINTKRSYNPSLNIFRQFVKEKVPNLQRKCKKLFWRKIFLQIQNDRSKVNG